MKPYRVIISGGGTGGHIFPALAIADTIKKHYPDTEFLFVGADDRMEMERVPAAGYPIVGLSISGFNRTHLFGNVKVLQKLFKSLRKAKKIVRDFRPDVVIGVGGYASGPTLWSATSLGIPTLIHEQNSYAGVTNKLLGKRISRVCTTYDNMERFFPKEKIVLVGCPVRKDLEESKISKEEALAYYGFDLRKKTILVVGGSLGARTINRSVEVGLPKVAEAGVNLIWQTGRYYQEQAQEALKAYPDAPIACSDFIVRMDLAYAAADLVISRAGAGTIAELSLLAKPAILVPSPNVAEDHQTKNAMALVDKEAAILVRDADAEEQLMKKTIEVVNDDALLAKLKTNIAPLAHPHSAELIVDEVMKLIEK